MLKLLFTLTLTFISLLSAYGQNNDWIKEKEEGLTVPDRVALNPKALYILRIEGKRLELRYKDDADNILKHLQAEWIESINIVNSKDETEKYGPQGTDGVVLIALNEDSWGVMPTYLKRMFR